MDHADGAALQQGFKAFGQENVLARADGDGGAVAQALVLVGILPGDHVLRPGDVVFLDPPAQADAVLHAEVAEVVDGQGHLIPDDAADLLHILLQDVQALFGHMDAGEGMGDIEQVVRMVPRPADLLRHGAVRPGQAFQGIHLLHEPQRRADRAGHVPEDPEAQVHLQEGEAHGHAGPQRPAHLQAGMLSFHVGIAVDADPVAVFPAQHLVHRHAVRLAGQVPQGDLHPADAAALPGRAAELFDAAEQLLHIAGVLAQEAALQHFGIDPVPAVPDLAEADDPLVGVNLHEGAVHRGVNDVREADIGDLQLAGGGSVKRISVIFSSLGAELRLNEPVRNSSIGRNPPLFHDSEKTIWNCALPVL